MALGVGAVEAPDSAEAIDGGEGATAATRNDGKSPNRLCPNEPAKELEDG